VAKTEDAEWGKQMPMGTHGAVGSELLRLLMATRNAAGGIVRESLVAPVLPSRTPRGSESHSERSLGEEERRVSSIDTIEMTL
jgi:hypothetical protein